MIRNSLGKNAFLMPEVRGEIARPLLDDRQATETHITTGYNRVLQKNTSEPTTRRTFKLRRVEQRGWTRSGLTVGKGGPGRQLGMFYKNLRHTSIQEGAH